MAKDTCQRPRFVPGGAGAVRLEHLGVRRVGRRRTVLTFLAALVGATLAVNTPGARSTSPEVVQRVRLAAQAAEVPVPRPLSIEGTADAPPPAASASDVPIAPPPEQFSGPAPARVAPPAALKAAVAPARGLQSGTWAVVVGINDYPGAGADLNYAVNDATDAVDALTRQGAGDHIMFLRDGQVTVDVLRSAVSWLTNNAGPDAVAVFYYAGHVKKVGGSEAIVTADGGTVTDNDLASWLRPLAAHQAWITIAACYGGGFTEVLAPGRVLTAAAGADNIAYESSAFGRSYLGEYMVRRAMVQGAASDTVQSAFSWAHATISQEYPGREPVQYDNGDGALTLRPHRTSSQYDAPPGDAASPPSDGSYAPPPEQPPAPSEPPPDEGSPPSRNCRGLLCFR